jgi:predicted TIM-barrel fold metal-dependent hydrolase
MRRRRFLAISGAVLSEAAGARPALGLVRRARGPDGPYLDAHAHVQSPRVADIAEQLMKKRVIEPVTGADLVRRMDAGGTRRALVLSTAYLAATDAGPRDVSPDEERRQVEQENDFAAQECGRFADRLVPFLSVNPKRSWAVDEIDRCVDRLGMKGLKLLFWNSMVDTRQPEQLGQVRKVFERAADRGLPIVAHIFVGAVEGYGPDDTERFVTELVKPVPTLRISVAHLAGAGGFAARTQACFERFTALCGDGTPLAARVWTDMAATIFRKTPVAARQRMGELVKQFGVERTLFGTDGFEGYAAEVREVWPLGADDWARFAANQGAGLLGG